MTFARPYARTLRCALTLGALASSALARPALARAHGVGKASIELFMSPASPDFRAVRVTGFLKDDGTDLTDVEVSDDGKSFANAPNTQGRGNSEYQDVVAGADDRHVDFAQTVGLVQLLRALDVYYELTFDRMGVFLTRFVWNKEKAPSMTQ